MSRGNLKFAAEHAHVVEQLEEIAPPVTAKYLQDAYDRMKLPLKIGFLDDDEWEVEHFIGDMELGGHLLRNNSVVVWCDSAESAVRFYLNLCQSLLPPSIPVALPPATGGSSAMDAPAEETTPPGSSALFQDPALSNLPAETHGACAATSTGAGDTPPVSFFSEAR